MSYNKLSEKQRTIHEGMINLGFKPLLEKSKISPVNITFMSPDDEFYDFNLFFEELRNYGYIILPETADNKEGFKLQNIEDLNPTDIEKLLDSVMKSMYWEWIAI